MRSTIFCGPWLEDLLRLARVGQPTRGSAVSYQLGAISTRLTSKPSRPLSPGMSDVVSANDLLQRYLREEGAYPPIGRYRGLGHRHHAHAGGRHREILYLLGIRPRWQAESRRFADVGKNSAGRTRTSTHRCHRAHQRLLPRCFPNLVAMLDGAVTMAAEAEDERSSVTSSASTISATEPHGWRRA